MLRLPEQISINGTDYDLIKRIKQVALYSINGGRCYEVSRINIRPKMDDAFL